MVSATPTTRREKLWRLKRGVARALLLLGALAGRLWDAQKKSLPAIQRIPIHTPGGALVQLSQVAEVSDAEGYSFIRREQLQRYAVIQMDVRGRDIDGFVKEASAAIAQQVKLPSGYYTEWGGAFENQQQSPRTGLRSLYFGVLCGNHSFKKSCRFRARAPYPLRENPKKFPAAGLP